MTLQWYSRLPEAAPEVFLTAVKPAPCRFQLKKMAYSQAGSASPAGQASPQASRPSTASSVEGQQVRARVRAMPSADMAAQVSSHIIGCLRQQNVLAQAVDSSLWCQPPRLKMIMLALLWCKQQLRPLIICRTAKQLFIHCLRWLRFACREAALLAWHPSAGCPPPPACTGQSASQAYHQTFL